MRRTWQIRRETSEQPDGQIRWDHAYQLLLGWTATSATDQEGAAGASGVVRARLHRPPAAGPDHRTASHPAARLGGDPRWVDRPRGAHLPRRRPQRRQAGPPGLDALRDHAARAAFDAVLVTAPDRLARNFVHQMVVLEELERRGVGVVFCDRPLSDDPHERLVAQIRGAVAEYERVLIADRMRRGRLARLRSGQLLPWTRAPYGYRLHPERPRDPTAVQVDPVAAVVVQELFAAYAAGGVTLHALAAALTARRLATPTGKPIWRASTVRQLLTNPAYKGQAASGRLRTTPAQRRKSALEPIGRG
jgi:DNA invertase Pin-like site-specific DNA recombinase